MSPEYEETGRAWISSQVQVVGCVTRPSTENDHDATSRCGVTSAFSTGHWSPASYWPGGRRGSRAALPRPKNPLVGFAITTPYRHLAVPCRLSPFSEQTPTPHSSSSTIGGSLCTSPTRDKFGRVRPTCPGLPTQAEDWPDGDGAARPLKRLASHWRPADTCCPACRQKLFGRCCPARRPSADSGSIIYLYLSIYLNWTYLVGLIIIMVGRPGLDPGTLGLKAAATMCRPGAICRSVFRYRRSKLPHEGGERHAAPP